METREIHDRAAYLGLTALSPNTTDDFVKALRIPNIRMTAEKLRGGLVRMSAAVPAAGVPDWVRDETALLRDAAAAEGLVLVPQTPDAAQQRAFLEGTGRVSPGNGLGTRLHLWLLEPAAKKLPEVIAVVASGQIPPRARRVWGAVFGLVRFALLMAGAALLAMVMFSFGNTLGTPASLKYQFAALMTVFFCALLIGDFKKSTKPLRFWGRVLIIPKLFTFATFGLLALFGFFLVGLNNNAIKYNEMMMQIEEILRSMPEKPKTWDI